MPWAFTRGRTQTRWSGSSGSWAQALAHHAGAYLALRALPGPATFPVAGPGLLSALGRAPPVAVLTGFEAFGGTTTLVVLVISLFKR
jgi:hypothetical protein